MESILLALAPAVPTTLKVGITFIMFAFAFGLTTSLGKRKAWKPIIVLSFFILSAATVVALDFCYPDIISRGLDGRGILAALIGLVAGAISVPWSTRKPPQQ